MRKRKLHTVTIIVGTFLAFAMIFSQFLPDECIASSEKEKTEQTDSKRGAETGSYISLPDFSLPAPVHVQANLNPYCLFEILFEEDIDEDYVEENLFHTDRIFETMFRVIISPNAP
jgi:hypothetical protein